jgi:hypothetical protein
MHEQTGLLNGKSNVGRVSVRYLHCPSYSPIVSRSGLNLESRNEQMVLTFCLLVFFFR